MGTSGLAWWTAEFPSQRPAKAFTLACGTFRTTGPGDHGCFEALKFTCFTLAVWRCNPNWWFRDFVVGEIAGGCAEMWKAMAEDGSVGVSPFVAPWFPGARVQSPSFPRFLACEGEMLPQSHGRKQYYRRWDRTSLYRDGMENGPATVKSGTLESSGVVGLQHTYAMLFDSRDFCWSFWYIWWPHVTSLGPAIFQVPSTWTSLNGHGRSANTLVPVCRLVKPPARRRFAARCRGLAVWPGWDWNSSPSVVILLYRLVGLLLKCGKMWEKQDFDFPSDRRWVERESFFWARSDLSLYMQLLTRAIFSFAESPLGPWKTALKRCSVWLKVQTKPTHLKAEPEITEKRQHVDTWSPMVRHVFAEICRCHDKVEGRLADLCNPATDGHFIIFRLPLVSELNRVATMPIDYAIYNPPKRVDTARILEVVFDGDWVLDGLSSKGWVHQSAAARCFAGVSFRPRLLGRVFFFWDSVVQKILAPNASSNLVMVLEIK